MKKKITEPPEGLDARIERMRAELMYREVRSWTGSMADSFWDDDDDDDDGVPTPKAPGQASKP